MRLRHHSGRVVYLSCGATVRPARDLTEVVAQLDAHAAAVRARLDVDTLCVSLGLPPSLAAALAVDARARTRLRAELTARGVEVRTLSGTGYADAEAPSEQRHGPDWSSPARLEYTLDLARILVDLLPDDAVRGAVSTVGLGRRAGWDAAREKAAARILGRLSAGLAEIAWQHGRAVRVGFRPEPGYVLDTAEHTVAAFATLDRDRLGVCLDLANLACTWRDPVAELDALGAAGVPVIRAQVSAALEVPDPAAARDALRGHVDHDHPHQVTTPAGGYADDLADALRDMPAGPWRVRYHVPAQRTPAPPLAATAEIRGATLRRLVAGDVPCTEYLDVGGETWDPFPPGDPAAPADAVAAELAYAAEELTAAGLAPPTAAWAAR
jgi:hypothetical protein